MLNNPDPVSFVLTGTLLVGNQPLYDVLDGKKPVIIGNAVTTAEFLTTAADGYPTGSPGVIPGTADFAARLRRAGKGGHHVRRQSAGQVAYARCPSRVRLPRYRGHGVPVADPAGPLARRRSPPPVLGPQTPSSRS